MRPLTYVVASSLDGRIAAPDGSFDVFGSDPAYGAALAQDWGDALPTGRPLVDGAYDPRSWRLEATRTFDVGVVLLEHARQS